MPEVSTGWLLLLLVSQWILGFGVAAVQVHHMRRNRGQALPGTPLQGWPPGSVVPVLPPCEGICLVCGMHQVGTGEITDPDDWHKRMGA